MSVLSSRELKCKNITGHDVTGSKGTSVESVGLDHIGWGTNMSSKDHRVFYVDRFTAT